MDTTFAIKGKDFVLMVADATVTRSIFKLKEHEDKIFTLNDDKLISIGGVNAESKTFGSHLQRSVELYKYRHGYDLTTKETAHWTRQECNRGRAGQVMSIIAGCDKDVGPQLYWLDYIGTMQQMNFAAHGYASYFLLSIFDNKYKPGMTEKECIGLAKECIEVLNKKFLASQNFFTFKIVDANGIRNLKL